MIENRLELVETIDIGSGSGTTDYNLLFNKPSINGVELIGNKTLDELEISCDCGDVRSIVISILAEYGLIQLEGLTSEQIAAINNMSCDIDENGNLEINYDDTVLAINFEIENGNLIAETNIDNISFNINSNGEMEAIY